MNYLSHYYIFYERKEPEYSLGKILPDLVRTFHKKTRLQHISAEPPENPEVELMVSGVVNHLAVDKLFHDSSYFSENTAEIKKILKDTSYDSIQKYFYFYAHILLELILDRLLLKHDKNIGINFYKQLEAVKEETIAAFFRYNGIDLPVKEFFIFLQGFIRARYLFEYVSNDRLIYALGRINYKAGLYDFTTGDVQKLIGKIEEIEAYLQKDYLQIFKHIENELT